jgi:hypothetical protein
LPPGSLLDGTAQWVEAQQQADGSLANPPELLDYPHAPWWNEGGQTQPDSIVGRLMASGKANDTLIQKTRQWVKTHRTLENIQNEEWLFMLYHAYDYFMNDDAFPEVETFRQATIERITTLAQAIPENQIHSFFTFAPTPQSRVTKAAPDLVNRFLDILQAQQQDDGSWHDQHDLPQWFSYTTILNLLTLRRYGRFTN